MNRDLGKRFVIASALIVCMIGLQQLAGIAQQAPVDASQLQVPPTALLDSLRRTGEIEVWVSLLDPSVGEANGPNAKRRGALSAAAQRNYARQLGSAQDALVAQVVRMGGREIARVRKAHNAVAVRIDASRLGEISSLPGVRSVRPVRNYKMDLATTVPYIGAAAVQALGVDGTGVKVAVLDSGIDYTHRNLDGSGLVEDFVAAYGTSAGDARNRSRDGLFPTAKVIDGFDFVGEVWPNGPLASDDDPIDINGHGTHVADIIAGHSLDNTHKGVAPGANLVAIKVCSSVSTACSGVALLQALDLALDPNGDEDLSDAVDVINMSLGSDYGQKEDDLAEASDLAAKFGVVVVAAAGNASNRPYVVSSPAVAPHVIAVAQTNVPTAAAIPLVINSPAAIAGAYRNTATLDFAPVTAPVSGDVAYVGRGCPADSIAPGSPADPYLASPAGKVALIDRGSCNVSLKIDRAAGAGAIAVLLGLVAPGDPVGFALGGGTTFVPSLVITQSTANIIKGSAATVNVTLTPSNAIPLVGSVVGSSSRGPSYSLNAIKPEIGAPGASVSAVAGTGTREGAFSGTSGATPMISGSAALLLAAEPLLTPVEVKALLMNTAETRIFANPQTQPGLLAPITRIGAGEVRVNRAILGSTAVWDEDNEAGSVSFGYVAVKGQVERNRRVLVTNYSNKSRTYSITSSFRFEDDVNGAVQISTPATVHVPAGAQRWFRVTLQIDPTKLPIWTLNGGSNGGNGDLLDTVEFDGYLTIADAQDTVHVPWHVLPHRAAGVTPLADKVHLVNGVSAVQLANDGAVGGRVEVFSLTGTSTRIPNEELPEPGDNFAVIDLKAVGVRLVSAGGQLAIQFGIATNRARSHPNYPAEFDILIDSNRDGVFDYAVFNSENGGFAASGQNVVTVVNLTTNLGVTRFFADADLDSSNFIATALLSDLGLTPSSQFDFSVVAGDNYFTGAITDAVESMTYMPGLPRFVGSGVPQSGVPAGGASVLTIQEVAGGDQASPSQTGLLLLYRDAVRNKEASLIKVK